MINGSDVTQLKENSPVEAVVGRLSCLDQDASQSHVYSLQSNGDVFMVRNNIHNKLVFFFIKEEVDSLMDKEID